MSLSIWHNTVKYPFLLLACLVLSILLSVAESTHRVRRLRGLLCAICVSGLNSAFGAEAEGAQTHTTPTIHAVSFRPQWPHTVSHLLSCGHTFAGFATSLASSRACFVSLRYNCALSISPAYMYQTFLQPVLHGVRVVQVCHVGG